jgi:translocation and assembly module TamA
VQWDNAKQQLLKKMLARRYAAATLMETRADVQPDTRAAELDIRVDSGPAYRIGAVQVQGASRYSEDLVQRLARLEPGSDYVQGELVDAEQRLTDSGFFDSAYLSLDLTSDPAHATVIAVVKEASLQKVVYGIGVSTDTGLRLSLEHTHNQVPGIGWRAVNKITADRDTTAFSSDWTSQPDASQWRWAVSALMNNQRIGEIDVVGQRYRTGRFTTGAQWDQSYYLQFDRSDVTYRESNSSEANEAISANYAFTYRRFDSMPFPSEGWAVGGELSVGTTLGPVAEPFSRVLLRGRSYLPLASAGTSVFERQRTGRLALRAEAGTVVVNNTNAIPFTQLFLAGGDNSVRGYKWQEIGVSRDGEITAEAGRYLTSGSVEWQRPIVVDGLLTAWESALFVDAGAVANEPDKLDLKVGVGVGARWKSPIGPLQADLAYGVAVQKFRLHLSVGFVF